MSGQSRWRAGIVIPVVLGMWLIAMATAAPAKPLSVYIGSEHADRAETPTSFSPDDYFGYKFVREIHWSTWGGSVATGAGDVSLVSEEESGSPFPIDEPTSPVSVTLSGRQRCAGLLAYTTYSLVLAPGAVSPPDWPTFSSGRFRCYLALAGGYHGQRLGAHSNCIHGLYEPTGDPREHIINVASWFPTPPGGSYWLLCRLHFSGWGTPRAIGGGIAAIAGHAIKGQNEWPIRIELSKPVWCPRASDGYGSAIGYSLLKIRFLGSDFASAGVRSSYRQRMNARGHSCELL